jgi:hypothetical protein
MMELSGNLTDFALSDILQILALSRKTGIVVVENGAIQGRIVLENGRVVFASSSDQHRLEERIAKRTGVKLERIQDFKDLILSEDSCWTFEDLMVESGLLKRRDIVSLVRDHVLCSIAKLVSIDKGRFGIALNEKEYQQTAEEIRLREGIEVNEALLEAAKNRDEEACYDGCIPSESKKEESDNESFLDIQDRKGDVKGIGEINKVRLLYSFLSELSGLSYESEVILTVMRFCSEFASRGVLFSVFGETLRGIGKFGIDWAGSTKGIEDVIRSINIPINEVSIFREAVVMERPIVYCLEEDVWLKYLRTVLGGKHTGLEAFLIPLSTSPGQGATYIIYGDNPPGKYGLNHIDSLLAFINQASVTIEKIKLKERLEVIDSYSNRSYAVERRINNLGE